MTRHRGTYNPANPAPFELSRSKVDQFVKCRACFWLEKVAGVAFPSTPPFLINSNTDRLLKRDFDRYRGRGPHPLMVRHGLAHLQPYAHPDLDKWVQSIHFGASDRHFNVVHAPSNIRFGGGIDDVWQNTETGELHVVDYKSTSNQSENPAPVTLNGEWKLAYKRQMDMYQWILRRKGFPVSDTGYFVYVDGLHVGIDGMLEEDPAFATMRFATSLIPYRGDEGWVEPALMEIRALLDSGAPPQHAQDCEFGRFIAALADLDRK